MPATSRGDYSWVQRSFQLCRLSSGSIFAPNHHDGISKRAIMPRLMQRFADCEKRLFKLHAIFTISMSSCLDFPDSTILQKPSLIKTLSEVMYRGFRNCLRSHEFGGQRLQRKLGEPHSMCSTNQLINVIDILL